MLDARWTQGSEQGSPAIGPQKVRKTNYANGDGEQGFIGVAESFAHFRPVELSAKPPQDTDRECAENPKLKIFSGS